MKRPANLPSGMRLVAGILVGIYMMSIAGYVLLDGTHELLHAFRSSVHHHEHVHEHGHHHVEDHHHLSLDTDSTKEVSVVIYYFHLFFQVNEPAVNIYFFEKTQRTPFNTLISDLNFPPATPPPL